MKTIELHHIDSFTDKAFEGNSTAAIFGAEMLLDEEMKKIACELKHSETCFIFPSEKADIKLRFFTLNGDEIKFCGHATLGALRALYQKSQNVFDKQYLTIETSTAVLKAWVKKEAEKDPRFSFDLPAVDLIKAPYDLKELLKELEIDESLIDTQKPLMLERGNNYLYFCAKSLKSLSQIQIDMKKAIEFAKKDQIIIFCILVNEAFCSENHVHSRGFAPLVGVDEDPYTGSMQGGVFSYLLENNMIDKDRSWIGSEQGHFVKRPGFAEIELIKSPKESYRLHAFCKHIYSTSFTIDFS